jgi:hypothetical protein
LFLQKLCSFLSNDLDEVAALALKFSKWQRCLDIDNNINEVFLILRDVYLIGPEMILENEGRHKAFLRMAKCYFIVVSYF